MRDRNVVMVDDFEIVNKPSPSGNLTTSTETEEILGTQHSIRPELEAQDPTAKAIKDLFEPQQKPDQARNVARIVIILSLPFVVAWTTLVTVLSSLYSHDSEEQVFQNVSEQCKKILDSYLERLRRKDGFLPEYTYSKVLVHVHTLTTSLKNTKLATSVTKAMTSVKSFLSITDHCTIPIFFLLTRGPRSLMIYLLLQYWFPTLRSRVRFVLQIFMGWRVIPMCIICHCITSPGGCKRVVYAKKCWVEVECEGFDCHK